MPHHAVTNHNHPFESAKDLANLFSREPPHIAATRDEGCVKANAATAGEGIEEGRSSRAEGRERDVEVERGDLAGAVIAIIVVCKGVDGIGETVGRVLG